MKLQMIQILVSFYQFLLRLYPRRFREGFAEEMSAVFQQTLTTAPNNWHILTASLRELRDWPLNCLREHWHDYRRSLVMSHREPISWRSTITAVAPLLLFSLIIAVPLFSELAGLDLTAIPGTVITYIFVGIFLLGIAVAWRHGWPAWSASWLGLLLFILLYLWGPSFIYLPEYEWNTMPRLLKMLLSETILPLLWLLTLYWLLQHWSHVGLLAFLPALAMEGVLYTEFVPPVSASLIMFIIWLVMAVVGVLLLRLRQRQWDAWIISIGALFGWSLYLYAGHFLTEVVVREQTVTAMVTNLVPLMLRGLVPLIGLMLFHALWLWAQAAGRFALQSYRYFFIGIFLNLAASLSFRRLLLPDDLVAFQVMGVWVITAVFLLSLSLMATGSARLIRHHHQWIVHANWLVHLLLTLILVFPLIYQAEAIVAGYNSLVRNQLSFELLFWQWTPTQRIFLTVSLRFVGLIWLLLSGVALSLFHHRQPSEPTATADPAFPP